MWLQIPDRPTVAGKPRRRMSRAHVLRIALIAIAVGAVLIVGIRLWTAGPDTVRIIITQYRGISDAPDVVTTLYDHTVHDAALAQRLQRDLSALPIAPPIYRSSCPSYNPYDIYTLAWSRSGLFVEQATASTAGCDQWIEDGVIVRFSTSDAIFQDMHAALGTPLPPLVRSSPTH